MSRVPTAERKALVERLEKLGTQRDCAAHPFALDRATEVLSAVIACAAEVGKPRGISPQTVGAYAIAGLLVEYAEKYAAHRHDLTLIEAKQAALAEVRKTVADVDRRLRDLDLERGM